MSAFPDQDEEQSSFLKKIKESPMVPAGVVAGLGTLIYAVRDFKNSKGKMSPSIYIMQYRVVIQSIVIGFISVGMLYNMGKTLNEMYERKNMLPDTKSGRKD
ncbi:hypothetical protein LSTR_LSTR003793 [Laodelphax striatellus]|uniref:HIG1 domain-containing protein n=1 Tax=Laodelphax striatellus TaxID=195883 RepID=A0A482XEI6_LAOST|nr:hypothetical protein LSTR_LSTR003793 [Laodelphax striatellus]